MHCRLAAVPAPRRSSTRSSSKLTAKLHEVQDRRPAGRSDRHGRHHQSQAVRSRLLATSTDGLQQKGARARARRTAANRRAARAAATSCSRPCSPTSSNDWRIAREEIFGPVMVAIPWDDERGRRSAWPTTATTVWPRTSGRRHLQRRCERRTRSSRAGCRSIRGSGSFPGQSYGGYKQSGIGREYSLEGMLDSYTQRKSVTVNLQ